MPPKSKAAAKGAAAKQGPGDDDLDALLTEFSRQDESVAPPAAPSVLEAGAPPATQVQKGAESDEDDEDEGDDKAEAKKEKDKKRKKKKKDKGKAPAEAKDEAGPKLSAQAKAIQARQRAVQDEKERLERQREAEERRQREIEAQEEAERLAKEEEKRVKKEKAKARIEKQKAEGTYMTKAQKEKAARARAALEQMRVSGLVHVPGEAAEGEDGAVPAPPSARRPVYGKKRHKGKKTESIENGLEVAEKHEDRLNGSHDAAESPEAEAGAPLHQETATTDDTEAVPDDWDADGADDIVTRLADKHVPLIRRGYYGEEDEDEMYTEREQQERKYRELGLARRRREEEERARLDALKKEKEEEDRAARESEYRKREARRRRVAREEEAFQNRSSDKLRSPICCIMGHVDTGKTKLLDNIRRTNVQEGEAGGITQQIGATFFPRDTIETRTKILNETFGLDVKLPGLLIIDTPGHESFTNLRSRGSSLCDIAILVIDLMHGLEPQTIESINLLRRKRTPFVVALNKVDRCYGWKSNPNGAFQPSMAQQDENTQLEFRDRTERIIMQLMEQALNAKLYYENDDLGKTVSLIPTSAITGEGVPDLLLMLAKLTQERMAVSLQYVDTIQCTILEVKQVEGLGMTIDVVLVNGTLHEGDTIVVCTLDGPVVTTIRALLTPPPAKEIRVGHQFVHHQEIKAAMGIKIVATGLEKTVAGTGLMVVGYEDDVEDIREEVMRDLTNVTGSLETDQRGVTVQASTLGALEALLEYLRRECKPPVPVARVGIGPIFKKDVTQTGTNIEKGLKEYAVILAFDVKVDAEARSHAEDLGVRIFTADIIYHLFDQFSVYMKALNEQRKQEAMAIAVFPVVLKILPQHIFNAKIARGILRVGTPLVVTVGGLVELGNVTSIQSNHKEINQAGRGATVAVKIENERNPSVAFGRHFTAEHPVYAKISRESIDALKAHFREELSNDDWRLVMDLKKVFAIP